MDTIIEEYINLAYISTHFHDLNEKKQQSKKYGDTTKSGLFSGLAGLLGNQGIDLKDKIAQTTQVLVADFIKQGVK